MLAFTQTTTLLARGEAPGAAIWLMALGFTFICLFMMVVILIQKPKGGGLSGAFGGGAGGGGSDNFIGGGIGNVLTAVTVICFLIFLGLASGMTLTINAGDDVPAEEPEQTQAPDGAAAPEGGTELPPIDVEPEPEPTPEPETEPTEEPAEEPAAEVEGEAPAVDGGEEAEPAPAE